MKLICHAEPDSASVKIKALLQDSIKSKYQTLQIPDQVRDDRTGLEKLPNNRLRSLRPGRNDRKFHS